MARDGKLGRAPILPWQETQWRWFLRVLDAGRLAHALLLSGPEGTGKQTFARLAAARLLCRAPAPNGACGDCKSCLLVEAGAHPDLVLASPEEAGKAISVDTVRATTVFAGKKAMLGGWRVIVINSVDALTINATNALLKTLEEPGEDTAIFLLHHDRGRLLATIRSRCQQLAMPMPSTTQAVDWLHTHLAAVGKSLEHDELERLLALAGGRPQRALRLLESEQLAQLGKIEQALTAIARGELSPLAGADLAKNLPLYDIVERLQYRLTGVIKSRAARRESLHPAYFLYFDQLLAAKQNLLSQGNPNPQLFTEALLLGWRQLQQQVQAGN